MQVNFIQNHGFMRAKIFLHNTILRLDLKGKY